MHTRRRQRVPRRCSLHRARNAGRSGAEGRGQGVLGNGWWVERSGVRLALSLPPVSPYASCCRARQRDPRQTAATDGSWPTGAVKAHVPPGPPGPPPGLPPLPRLDCGYILVPPLEERLTVSLVCPIAARAQRRRSRPRPHSRLQRAHIAFALLPPLPAPAPWTSASGASSEQRVLRTAPLHLRHRTPITAALGYIIIIISIMTYRPADLHRPPLAPG